MKAVLTNGYGGPGVLYVGEYPDPVLKSDEVLVRVKATALNRADLLQREGLYPPPPGTSPVIGLEMAGVIEELGSEVLEWEIGDRVFALLPGGGYAEKVTVPAGMLMRIPEQMSFEEAASIPEVFLTAYLNLFWLGDLTKDKTVLIHAGASGIGTAAIQLAKQTGAKTIVTVRTKEKMDYCRLLGADLVLDGNDGFSGKLHEWTNEEGADIILDCIGASYWQENLKSISFAGKIIVIGVMGGGEVEKVPLMELIKRRISLIGSSLRSRTQDEKIKLSQEFVKNQLPHFSTGKLRTFVDKIYHLNDVQEAHRYMGHNANIGKIVLKVSE